MFGSLTRPGVFNARSDIDLALLKEFKDLSVYGLAATLEERLGRPVDIVLLSRCRFAAKILREGGGLLDELGLRTLRDEILADCQVAEAAWNVAMQRFSEDHPAAIEGCAHHLARLYNVIEQMALRVAKAFENRIDDDAGWHAELIGRLSLEIEGVRPALFPADLRQPYASCVASDTCLLMHTNWSWTATK